MDRTPAFPADVEVTVSYLPLQAFGMSGYGGNTSFNETDCKIRFDPYTGHSHIECDEPVGPLQARIEEPTRLVLLNGNVLTVHQPCESLEQVWDVVEEICVDMPPLMNVDFVDPPYVERAGGWIGDVPFGCYQLGFTDFFDSTTKEIQQQRVVTALSRFDLVAGKKNRRLLGALHYFYIACRIRRVGRSPAEFLAESLLNLCKVIEVLYGSRYDDVRIGLRRLGYSDEEIERDFIPVMVLRNSMDVGHPSLSLFTQKQLETLQWYADNAERFFREYLQRLLAAVASGSTVIPDYEPQAVDVATSRAIELLGARIAKRARPDS